RSRPRHRAPLRIGRDRRAGRAGPRDRRLPRHGGLPRRPVARDGPSLALRLRRGADGGRARALRLRARGPRGGARGDALPVGRGRAGRRRRPRRPLEGGRTLASLPRLPRGGRAHAHAESLDREGATFVTLVAATLTESVKARALELGFDRVAIG